MGSESKKCGSEIATHPDARTNALISITHADKTRFTEVARTHDLSLSALFRLAADEYIKNRGW